MQNEGYSLQDLTSLVHRRAALVGATFLGVVLLSLVIAYSLDNLYRSSGTIVIEPPEVSNQYLPGTYQRTNPEQRIARIYDEVMTNDNLAKIVSAYDLYADERGDGSPESVVSELRSNFGLEFLLAEDDPRSRDSGEVTGFVLSYYHADPVTARNVARHIVELFQEENRQRRQSAYLDTAAALQREADSLDKQVSDLERQLAEFKTEHPGALPEDRNYNRQIAERKSRDLNGLDREIRSLQERKTLLQSQLATMEPWITALGPGGQTLPTSSEHLRTLQADYLRKLGNYNPNHPDVLRLKREIESVSGGMTDPAFKQAVETELRAKRIELMAARQDYAADHPDVRNLERAVTALEKQIDEMAVNLDSLPPPNNPNYVNLQVQIQGVNNELAALRSDRTLLRQEIRDLDQKVEIAPEVERRYLELSRDLGLARQQYEDTKSRQMSVQRAGALEGEDLFERYVTTSRPSLPYAPAYPNRPLFIVIGVFMGLTLGLGLGIAREAFDGTIRNTRDMQILLDAPPIAAISKIVTAEDQRRRRMARLVSASSVLTIVVIVAVYVHLRTTGII